MEDCCCWGNLLISSDFATFEINFWDSLWTNLYVGLHCTWLEKTRRFCRQVIEIFVCCFWTTSTCVLRILTGWRSLLTYMESLETVDLIQLNLASLNVSPTRGPWLQSLELVSPGNSKEASLRSSLWRVHIILFLFVLHISRTSYLLSTFGCVNWILSCDQVPGYSLSTYWNYETLHYVSYSCLLYD